MARACSLSGSIVAGHERPHDMFFLNRLKPEFLREANRRRPKVTTLLIEAPSACGRHQLRDLRQTRLEHAKELQATACDVTEVVAYSRIISNTCIRSSFDVLITFKISAVAVCCSRPTPMVPGRYGNAALGLDAFVAFCRTYLVGLHLARLAARLCKPRHICPWIRRGSFGLSH